MPNRVRTKREVANRLKSRRLVDPTTGCWFLIRVRGPKRGSPIREGKVRPYYTLGNRSWPLARVAAWIWNGFDLESPLNTCHTCDDPFCWNPAHLFAGTQADNLKDMAAKGRSTRGEKNSRARLTEKDVRTIRFRCKQGESFGRVGRDFSLKESSVAQIVRGARWGHLC